MCQHNLRNCILCAGKTERVIYLTRACSTVAFTTFIGALVNCSLFQHGTQARDLRRDGIVYFDGELGQQLLSLSNYMTRLHSHLMLTYPPLEPSDRSRIVYNTDSRLHPQILSLNKSID